MPTDPPAPFGADATIAQVTTSMGAMLLLHASNQALIEAQVAPSSSPWYPVLDQQLGGAQDLVLDWRRNGFLYFGQRILGEIVACGRAFAGTQATTDALFAQLEQLYSDDLRQSIADAINGLDTPVAAMTGALDAYLASLAAFQTSMETPAAAMTTSVARIQAQEAQIAAEISAINAQIASLQQQVVADRQAIARAEAARGRGIVETIFGVLLAPVTGGVSLILAGIGVGTIAEAQEQVDQLQSTIAGYQSSIVADQGQMSSDQQQVSALGGLVMGMALIQSDIAGIAAALGVLRTTWSVLQGSIADAAQDVARSTDAAGTVLARLWFDVACGAWREVSAFAAGLQAQDAPVPDLVTIGG